MHGITPYAVSPWRWLALVVFAAVVCLRMPGVVMDGRFWAEEGTVYFTRAWIWPWWRALFAPAMGYLSLAANAAALLARKIVPLEDAPHVTIAIALEIQVLPALLLVTAKDWWLRRPAVLFAAVVILATPPVSGEVWLNIANSQFHISLAAALCLVLEIPSRPGAIARTVLLFLAPLCSPGSIALVPLFAARAAFDRQKGRAVQAASILTGALLQLVFFYNPSAGRGHIPGPATLASILAVRHLAIPLLGEQAALPIAQDLHGSIVAGQYPIAAMMAVCVAGGLMTAAIWTRGRAEPMWLVLAGAAIAALSYYGAIGGPVAQIAVVGGNRYAFAPCMLFELAVLSIAANVDDRLARGSACVVAWLLAIGVQQSMLPQDKVFETGPIWRAQIAAWRTDPSFPIAIWPTGWMMHLPTRQGDPVVIVPVP